MNPYEELANAIIVKAAKDYRRALGILKYSPNDERAGEAKHECECFFHSGWFATLTKLDGDILLNEIQKQVRNGR